jgi:hypothetical protein
MEIKNISKQDAFRDYMDMLEFDLSRLTTDTKVGNKWIDHFTFEERLNTISIKGINFKQFIEHHLNTPAVKKMIDFYKGDTRVCILYKIYKFMHGTVGLFSPIRAREILYIYQPNTVLDPCMGWGCRMTGTASLGIPRYIGVDLNPNLRIPLTMMSIELQRVSNTSMQLFFGDCLQIDYSKLVYDCIFTSPPYFNTELYTGTERRTKKDWVASFYEPLFKVIWRHLQPKGVMILSIPKDVFSIVCRVLNKQPITQYPFLRRHRSKEPEYIYVWSKD